MTLSVKNSTGATQTINTIADLMADGGQVTIGAKADAAVTNPASTASAIALLKGLLTALATNHTDEAQLHTDIGTTLHADLTAATPAGTNIIGKVTTDQTTHGTTDLVAADITKVAGAAISQGHGTAATAVRVELPTDGTGVVGLAAGTNLIGKATLNDGTNSGVINSAGSVRTGGLITNPSANFTRPANTTAYASGQLVANSTTAGSVTAMSFTCTAVTSGSFIIRRLKMLLSSTVLTNASFRLHLFTAAPGTITNGDGGTFSVSSSTYIDSIDVTCDRAFTDGAIGTAAADIAVKLASGTTIVGLIEARAAYTPTSGEVITCSLDVLND